MIPTVGVSADYNQHGDYYSQLSDEVRMYIHTWTPRKIPHAQWITVEDFVKNAVSRIGAPSLKRIGNTLRFVTMFVLWARSAAIPLEFGAIFDTDVIERFVRVEYERIVASNFEPLRARSHISLLSNVLTAIAMQVHSTYALPNPLPYKLLERDPYLPSDMAWIRTWAAVQPSSLRRQAAHAMLALCLGAGLTRSELMHTRNGDVVEDEDGFIVHIYGEHPRILPIDPAWVGAMEKGMGDGPPDAFILYPNWSTRTWPTDRLNGDQPHQRVVVTRLRRTWVTERIGILPVDVLVRAAGFDSPASLVTYAPHVREFEGMELVRALRATK